MPNRNAYLAVCFAETTRGALVGLQDALEEHLTREGFSFDRMAVAELHMTFLFTGEQLSQLKADALRAWHGEVATAVEQADLSGEIVMRLSSIISWPPSKSNLLVAQFAVPARLHEVQKLVEASAHSSGIDSSGFGAQQKYDTWMPHVTLGKVNASRAAVKGAASAAADHVWQMCGRGVDEGVGVFAPIHGVLNALLAAPADGLTLCGDQPKQVWIDWRETLKFKP